MLLRRAVRVEVVELAAGCSETRFVHCAPALKGTPPGSILHVSLTIRGGFGLLAKLRGDVDGRRGVRVDDRDTGEWISEPEMFKGPVARTVKI